MDKRIARQVSIERTPYLEVRRLKGKEVVVPHPTIHRRRLK